MREEARQQAESLVYEAAKVVNDLSGIVPELVIEVGERAEHLLELLRRDRDISILVLAAGVTNEGPGPLVSMFVGPGKHPIPITIVPGALTDDEIDALG